MHVRRRLHPADVADDPEAGNPSDAADEKGAEDGIVIAPERSDTPS